MRFQPKGMFLVGMMAIAGVAAAQNAPSPPATVRTVIAATKLPTVTDVPLHFSVASVELAPGLKSSVSKANGVLYQLSGSTEILVAGETKMINPGEGLFIGVGKTAELKAGSGAPSRFLHFFLVSAGDLAATPRRLRPSSPKSTTPRHPSLISGRADMIST